MDNQHESVSPFWRVDKLISKEMCEILLRERKKQEEIDALVGYGGATKVVPEKRISKVVWAPNNHWIEGLLYNTGLYACDFARWNFAVGRPQQVQLTKYEVDGHYDWHEDQDFLAPHNVPFRKISVVAMLSDSSEFEGGEFEIKHMDGTATLTLQQGDVVVMPSFLTHRVKPVTKGVRYSAVCWITGPRMQ